MVCMLKIAILSPARKGIAMHGSHEYTRRDLDARFTAIIGKTVVDVDSAGVLTSPKAKKNKGRIGAVIEQSVLGYPADSDQRPDLDVDGEQWELKATGLVAASRGKSGWRAKEPMSITAVSPDRIIRESFSTSTFWHKAERLLVVYYLYVRPGKGVAVEYANFEFKGYDFHVWSVTDRDRLESDWTLIRDYVRDALETDREAKMPGLSTLVNPQLLYLDTSPKYPHPPRFRLKASLVTQMARERLDDNLEMIPDQDGLGSMSSVRTYLHELTGLYANETLASLAGLYGLPFEPKNGRENKSLAEQVVVRLFTGHAGKISQVPLFQKAGLLIKTVTLTPTGSRTEDMKLNPAIDFDELTNPNTIFDDASFAAPFIDSTLIVVILQEQWPNCPLRFCRFKGFKSLWLGAYCDQAETLWHDMRNLIFTDQLIDAPVLKKDGTPRITPKTGLPMTAPNWPKSNDGVLFVRGSGTDATDKPVEVNGIRMYRQNVWLKGKEIADKLETISFI